MRDLNKMLDTMKDNEQNQEFEGMTDLEKRRIYQQAMQKIDALQKEEEGTIMNRETMKKEQGKKKGYLLSKHIMKAAAAIGIAALVGGTAFAGWKLHDSIKTHFQIHDKKTEQKVEKMVSTIDQSVKSAGVTVSVRQVIGDENGFYAVLEAKNAPNISEELQFEQTKITINGIPETQAVEWDSPQMGAVDEDKGVTTFTLRINTQNVSGKKIHLSLKNLGYRDEKNQFIAKNKGTWKFAWTLNYKNETKKVTVSKNIKVRDTKAVWDDIVISPLSVTVHYTQKTQGKQDFSEKEWEKLDGKDRLVVQLKDGRRIDSRFDNLLNDGVTESDDQKTIFFDQVISLSDIQSIRFADRTYTFHKANLEKREKYTSKAANCTIELPKKLHNVITTQEFYNKDNKDLNCKENYTIFWGKKNGSKMALFSIHRLKGMHSDKEIAKKTDDFMSYIGYRSGYTYAIEYGEIVDEKQARNFTGILNQYIANVLPYFEYLK